MWCHVPRLVLHRRGSRVHVWHYLIPLITLKGAFRMILSNLKQPHQFNKRPHPSYDFVPGGGELIIGHMRCKIRNISQITPMIMAVPISTLLFESTLTGDGIWRENTLESYLHYWLEYVFSFKQGIDYWGCCEQLNSYWTNRVRFMGLIIFHQK